MSREPVLLFIRFDSKMSSFNAQAAGAAIQIPAPAAGKRSRFTGLKARKYKPDAQGSEPRPKSFTRLRFLMLRFFSRSAATAYSPGRKPGEYEHKRAKVPAGRQRVRVFDCCRPAEAVNFCKLDWIVVGSF